MAVERLPSSDHVSVEGTRIAAWAAMKSFREEDGSGEPPGPGRNGEREAARPMLHRRSHRHRIRPGADMLFEGGR